MCFSESAPDYRLQTLRFCPSNPRVRTLKVLLEYGASLDKLDRNQNTPLHVAAQNGREKVAKVN